MARRIVLTRIDADNSSGRAVTNDLRAACTGWRSMGRLHVGTGHTESTCDAGYTRLHALSNSQTYRSISLLFGGVHIGGLGRAVGYIAGILDRCQRLEQWLWQLGPAKPAPLRAFFGLKHTRLAGRTLGDHKEGDVMLPIEEIVGIRTLRQALYFKSGFLTHLTLGTLLDGLTELEVATWKGPGARAMRAFAQAQEHEALANDDDPNTDAWTRQAHFDLTPDDAVEKFCS